MGWSAVPFEVNNNSVSEQEIVKTIPSRAPHNQYFTDSGIARAFPGGQLPHPEGQNEEENK